MTLGAPATETLSSVVLHTGIVTSEQIELSAFFLIGLFGGAHCLGMCGPLVTMYAKQFGGKCNEQPRAVWSYVSGTPPTPPVQQWSNSELCRVGRALRTCRRIRVRRCVGRPGIQRCRTRNGRVGHWSPDCRDWPPIRERETRQPRKQYWTPNCGATRRCLRNAPITYRRVGPRPRCRRAGADPWLAPVPASLPGLPVCVRAGFSARRCPHARCSRTRDFPHAVHLRNDRPVG